MIGIDAVGRVEQSNSSTLLVGTRVGLFSRSLGTTKAGGLSHYLVANVDSAIVLPYSISSLNAMAIGTAGLTAAACVAQILSEGIQPSSGPILITGAGGVVLSVGMVVNPSINLSVYPFVLRGIKLLGINLDRIEKEVIQQHLDLAESLLPPNLLMEFVKVI